MSKDDICEGIHDCLYNALNIIASCRSIPDNILEIKAGLLTFAIEELGKALLLQDKCEIDKSEYEVEKSIFGRNSATSTGHKTKFQRGLEEIPKDLRSFSARISLNLPYDEQRECVLPNGETFRPNNSEYERIPPSNTINYPSFNVEIMPNVLDFEARKRFLYVDWIEKINQWSVIGHINLDSLNKTMNFLFEHITKKLSVLNYSPKKDKEHSIKINYIESDLKATSDS